MGIKFSVGISEGDDDRELLEELRRRSPAGEHSRGDDDGEPRAAGWPLRASNEDEAPVAGLSLWAW